MIDDDILSLVLNTERPLMDPRLLRYYQNSFWCILQKFGKLQFFKFWGERFGYLLSLNVKSIAGAFVLSELQQQQGYYIFENKKKNQICVFGKH